MGLWDRLFENKLVKPTGASSAAISRSTGSESTYQHYSTDNVESALHHWERVIWVFRCIDAIASNQASLKMLVKDTETDKKIGNQYKDLGRVLNNRANTYESAWQFRYRLSSILLLSNTGAFVEVVRDGDQVKELHILHPGSVTPMRDPKTFVKGYEVQTPNGPQRLKPENVIWFRIKPHPIDPYRQATPLTSAGLASDTDFLARMFNRKFLANDGRPGMAVSVNPPPGQPRLSPEDKAELKRKFSARYAGETAIIEGVINLVDMAANPRDVQWMEAIRGSKEDILLAFGTPESVLGNASGRTFDNADAERENFWLSTCTPHCDGIASGFDELTRGGDDPRYDSHQVVPDYDAVEVLQRIKRQREQKAFEELQAGAITVDEYRESTGKKTMGVPGSQVLWVPAGIVPVGGTDEITEAAQKLTQIGGTVQGGSSADSAQEGALEGISRGIARAQNINAARSIDLSRTGRVRSQRSAIAQARERTRERAGAKDDMPTGIIDSGVLEPDEVKIVSSTVDHYEHDRIAVEGSLTGVGAAWSRRLVRSTEGRLSGTKARKGTRHWEYTEGTEPAEFKKISATYILDAETWKEELVQDFTELVLDHAAEVTKKAMNEAGVVLDPDDITQPLSQDILDLVATSAGNQLQYLQDMITELDDSGAGMDEIKDAVKSFEDRLKTWIKSLSRTLATSTVQGTKALVYGYAESEGQGDLVWNSHEDDRTRATHWAADGSTARNGFFRIGESKLRFPGDPLGPVEETAQCRCEISYKPRVIPIGRRRGA